MPLAAQPSSSSFILTSKMNVRESFSCFSAQSNPPPQSSPPILPTGSYKSSFTAQHPSWFQVINYENYIPRLPPPKSPAKSHRPDLLTTGWICKIERGYITFHPDSSAYRNVAEQQELLMFDKVNIHCHYGCRGNRQRVSRGSELEMETQAACRFIFLWVWVRPEN